MVGVEYYEFKPDINRGRCLFMKFDSRETELYYYEQSRHYGLIHAIPIDKNMIWTKDDVDNLMSDLENDEQ
jgi:hypothetical protein